MSADRCPRWASTERVVADERDGECDSALAPADEPHGRADVPGAGCSSDQGGRRPIQQPGLT